VRTIEVVRLRFAVARHLGPLRPTNPPRHAVTVVVRQAQVDRETGHLLLLYGLANRPARYVGRPSTQIVLHALRLETEIIAVIRARIAKSRLRDATREGEADGEDPVLAQGLARLRPPEGGTGATAVEESLPKGDARFLEGSSLPFTNETGRTRRARNLDRTSPRQASRLVLPNETASLPSPSPFPLVHATPATTFSPPIPTLLPVQLKADSVHLHLPSHLYHLFPPNRIISEPLRHLSPPPNVEPSKRPTPSSNLSRPLPTPTTLPTTTLFLDPSPIHLSHHTLPLFPSGNLALSRYRLESQRPLHPKNPRRQSPSRSGRLLLLRRHQLSRSALEDQQNRGSLVRPPLASSSRPVTMRTRATGKERIRPKRERRRLPLLSQHRQL
jgi:hypothetical protein